MTIMPTLCNLINHSVCKHLSSGKYSITLADLGSSVPANWKWSPKWINVFMGYLDPNSSDAHGIIMTSSADELATIMASIRPAILMSAYVLIRLVSCLILNVCTKGNIQHNGIFIVYLRFDTIVYTFNENSQLTHDVVKAPKLTLHEKAPNIKKWFKEYTLPTTTPAPQIAALFYERILSAYMPENEPASLLDYSPLCATPLNACIQLKWSYHMHIISSLLSENETKLINSAVLAVLFSTDKDKVLKWISTCKATADIGGSSSHTSSSSSSTTKKSPRKKMASCKSDPGKHHKSDTISQEFEMEEELKSKGKEKLTTHRRNKSMGSSTRIASSETAASSSSGSSKRKRDSPTPSSPSKIAKTKKTKESKKASAEEQEEAPQSSSSSSSSSSSEDSDSSSSDDSNY